MSYPDETDPSLYPITEWNIDGTWQDVSDYVRGAAGPITITRGRQNEQGTISPTSCTYTVNNHDGQMSNRNPRSVWWRKIPSGIQTRVRAGDGSNYVHMRYSTIEDFTSVRTTDKAALDITGDIEVRADIRPWTWRPVGHLMMVASKWKLTGDQRSWCLYINTRGVVGFSWSPAGTSTRVDAASTVPIPATSGRLSIKVTVDVDNGAAGKTVTFYTASSITGTYTQLGAAVTTAGTSSIFSSSAALVIGGGDDDSTIFSNAQGFGGAFHGLHVYNGIAGSLVADPAFTGWAIDDTTYTDPKLNVWTLSGQARVSSPRIRFWGEKSSETQDSDQSVNDVYVPIANADILERLGSGRVPEESPLLLNIKDRPGITGYWPCEDGPDATVIASMTPGAKPGIMKDATFSRTTDLPGSKGDMTFPAQTAYARFRPKKAASTGMWTAVFFFKMPDTALPVADSQFVSILGSGYPATTFLQVSATQFRIRCYGDGFVTPLLDANVGFGTGVVVAGEWLAMRIKFTQNGANVDYEWAWYQAGSDVFWGTSGSFASSPGVGYPTQFHISGQANSAFNGMKVAHVVLSTVDLGFASTDSEAWSLAIDAYARERAATRIKRVAEQAGVYCEIYGDPDETPRLGPQAVARPLDVFLDAAKADGGMFAGLRDAYGVMFVCRQAAERRRQATLDYDTDLAEVPKPTDDGASVVNSFTLSRAEGSSAIAEITSGQNSTAEAPDGVGLRPGSADLNLSSDVGLQDRANLYARYGTHDQPRIPNLAVAFHRAETHPDTATGTDLISVDIGGTIDVIDWPTHLAPDRASFLVQGYTETLWTSLWDARFNTTQAGRLRTGMWTVPAQAAGDTRWGCSGTSSLDAGITSTATTIIVAATTTVTTPHVFTSVSARYPLDIMIGGEQITLNTPPGGSTTPQTFTGVTRSVNGIVKSHLAGAAVELFSKTYYGLGAGD